MQRYQRLSSSAYQGLKKGRVVGGIREIHSANNSLQKANEAMQMNDITQNQVDERFPARAGNIRDPLKGGI